MVKGQGNLLIDFSKESVDLSKLFQQEHNKFIDSVIIPMDIPIEQVSCTNVEFETFVLQQHS